MYKMLQRTELILPTCHSHGYDVGIVCMVQNGVGIVYCPIHGIRIDIFEFPFVLCCFVFHLPLCVKFLKFIFIAFVF